MAFPATLDELTDGVPADGAAATTALGDATYQHDDHHRTLASVGEALQAKVGIDDSAVTTALDYIIKQTMLRGVGEVSVTGATTLTSTAFGKWHVCSGTSADYTVTLPAASGNAGKVIGFRMASGLTKLVTLDGNASETIDGATTRVMWAQESAVLFCDGSNWFKVAGKSRPMLANMRRTSGQTGVLNATVTKVTLNGTDTDNTGLMCDPTTNNRINIKRTATYRLFGLVRAGHPDTGAWTAAAARFICNLYKNGAQIQSGEVYAPNGGYAGSPAETTVTLTAGDYCELYTYQNTGATQSIYGDATAAACTLQAMEIPSW